MKMSTRFVALALVLCLLLSVFPAPAHAAENGNKLTATEIPGLSRLETDKTAENVTQYAEDEMVTVIVMMEEPSVLDYFATSTYADHGEEMSAGEAVSKFLTSTDAKALSKELKTTQNTVINRIKTVSDSKPAATMEVVAQWTNLVNAMAVRIPYGKLDEIQNMTGVQRAYVQHEYDRPEELIEQSGKAGFSYDLVGLNSVWGKGITGEGMVIAVLDTGLDLMYSTWGDSSAPVTDIRRVHEAFTDDSFRTAAGKSNVRYTEEGMRQFLSTTKLTSNVNLEGELFIYDNNDLYKNLKVPYACDYADGDVNVQPESAAHGTHVAGTVAGYAVDEEGVVTFSGVAPDAQILAMKVFPDSDTGAQEYAIINALEDAALLGADVMNLSLGSTNGYAVEDTAAFYSYQRLQESGIVFMISAGNSAFSSMLNNRGDYNLTSDPEISMVGSPSTYEGNLSIASMDNTIAAQPMMTWTDVDGSKTTITFADPFEEAMKSMFTNANVAVIPVDGYGTYDDYYNAGFRNYSGYSDKGVSGIALVKRGGGLSFSEKINQATSFSWSYYDSSKGYYVTEFPVKGVIIYDEDPEATGLIYMSVEDALVTNCFISGKDGAALAAAAKAAIAGGSFVTLSVDPEDLIISNPTAGLVSEFSSWGAGPGLELKPDITAPGGNIWSAIIDNSFSPADPSGYYTDYVGAYGMMSGTSMAAPHMSGIAALVKQYVQNELNIHGVEAGNLTELLLMSTALPISDANGIYYSPRAQGAGLVSADGAVSTPAYITVDDMYVGKIELKDDPSKTGSYELTFKVNNLTSNPLTYNGKVTVLRPDTGADDAGHSFMLTNEVVLKTVDIGTVNVPANGSATVSTTVTLTDAEKATLDALFPNGIYVEGFVTLTAANGTDPQIGLPFLGFYGDWTSAPIFDSALWTDEPAEGKTYLDADTTWGVSLLGYFDGYAFHNLGQNPFDPTAHDTQAVYHNENITISPTGIFKSVNDFTLHQLREAKLMVVEVKDALTGELYYRDYTIYQFKNYFNYTYGMGIPSSAFYFTETAWDGTDLNGNVLPSGTQCVYTITAYGDGDYPTLVEEGYEYTDFASIIPGEKEPTFNGHAMDKDGDVITVDMLVDTEAPKLIDSTVSCIVENGRTYMVGTFTDDGSIASVEIIPQVKRSYNMERNPYADPDYFEYGMDKNNPFYSELVYDPDVRQWSFKVDVTEYAHTNESYTGENETYNFEWTGNVFIFGGDYGGNDRGYGVTVQTGEGLLLSTTSAKLYVGDTFDLNVINNTGSEASLTRTSTHPEVATVDEYGHIVAVAPGQTEIVISNGTDEVICVVAVEEKCTEIMDFDLSIDNFTGLKPDGSFVVNVTNLKPADVEITDVSWMVYENDPDWAGLLTVSKETSSPLSGRISLIATNDDSSVPSAGSGRLEVTLNGLTRSMTFSWDELYESTSEDGLVSEQYYMDQTIYINQGETADLIARYRQNHSFIPVELYTLEGYVAYSYDNPLTPSVGLVLDGPTFLANGAEWTGRLVALPGYELPTDIKVMTRYDYGYEAEMYRDSYGGFTYDSTTGEIVVKSGPTGATNKLVIRADGVAVAGAPGGTLSGVEYERPESTYGPFDWTVTEGNGTLTTGQVEDYYEKKDAAFYTPSEPGVSYITATTKDGRYSVNFAVICNGIQAEKVTLDSNKITLYAGQTYQLSPVLSPEPTLDVDKALVYESFNKNVAVVSQNGKITALSEGYAYINIETASGASAKTYCLVEVKTCTAHNFVDGVCSICGISQYRPATLVTDSSTLAAGDQIIIVAAGYDYALSTTQNKNNRGQAAVTKNADGKEVTFDETTQVITLANGSVAGTLAMTVDGQYLQAVSSSGNYLRTGDTLTDNGSWLISIDASGIASITASGSFTRNNLRYNSSSKLFACYAAGNSQKDVAIYRIEAPQIHVHSYDAVVTAPTCTDKGYTTYTCSCGDSYTADITAVTGHNFADGSCTVCGAADPNYTAPVVQDYYLVGYINDANYGCEEDWENLGVYKFVDGKLTATFASKSYVFVKTGDNANWYLAETYCEDTTVTLVKDAGEKMMVPANVELTFTLVVNADGTLTLSYAESQPEHSHNYEAVVTAPTCTEDGYTTYTCSCGDSYVADQVPATGHNYVDGSCTNCGAADPDYSEPAMQDYYLVGFINGANYGCEEDWQNMGDYKLVNGKLTATFPSDSYIFVKSGDNANWYMAKTYVQDTTGTFFITTTGANEKMFVPGNVELTFTLVENADGSLTLSYTESQPEHTHNYDAVVTAPTCTEDGYTTYTCACGDSYVADIVPAAGHSHVAVVTAPTCTEKGYTTYTCACGDSYIADYVPATGHNYVDGSCTNCGAADPDYSEPAMQDYYLVGFINGANYGCEEDWQNLGDYKLVNGKLTATFPSDSYIFVKSGDNANWYMAKTYVQDTTGTFYNTTTGANEKMFVPGNVELTFTLVENTDGSLTLTYTVAEEPVVKPEITAKSFTLSFEDEILVNFYYAVSDTTNVLEHGMLVFYQDPGTPDFSIADKVYNEPVYDSAKARYMATTDGIAAKEMGDTRYYVAYAKLTDGTYAYSKAYDYSPKKYAMNLLPKASTSDKQKALCVAMLNYGAAAQTYFGYNTDNLMNAELTAEQKALNIAYDETLFKNSVAADPAKIGSFAATATGFSKKSATVSFEGAFSINYYFTPSAAVSGDMTLYIWTPEAYAAAATLTAENATVVPMVAGTDGRYFGQVEGIAAKSLDETYYVAGVYTDANGNTYCTGVIAYSLSKYCINNAKPGKDMQELASATAMYGYYAMLYFNT